MCVGVCVRKRETHKRKKGFHYFSSFYQKRLGKTYLCCLLFLFTVPGSKGASETEPHTDAKQDGSDRCEAGKRAATGGGPSYSRTSTSSIVTLASCVCNNVSVLTGLKGIICHTLGTSSKCVTSHYQTCDLTLKQVLTLKFLLFQICVDFFSVYRDLFFKS